MAADLQEPPTLILEFDRLLRQDKCDVAIGQRASRSDAPVSDAMSALFWKGYRRFVQPEMPEGGVDIFGCNRQVRDQLLALTENNSSLVGHLFWLGYRRETVPYHRAKREIGKSAWTLKKKLTYLSDSIFSFSNLPVVLLMRAGLAGLSVSFLLGIVLLVARLSNQIDVPGYTATALMVIFFGGLNCFGLGIVGNYAWRAYENTKHRPNFIIARSDEFN